MNTENAQPSAPVDAVVRDEMLAAIKRAIDGSIPYILEHNAFMITADSWKELAAMVCPMVRRIKEAVARMNRGEKLTEAEIREILG